MSQPVERFGVITGMIETAENLAKDYDITREQADAYAVRRHQRAAAAWDKGLFDAELVPVSVPQQKSSEERTVGEECVRKRRSPWSPNAAKKKTAKQTHHQ